MSLFDATGVILIAVDNHFTLEEKDGIEVNRNSIHRQFLEKYYTKESGHKDIIAKTVAERGEATEIPITIGDKVFVLFAYSTQGERADYGKDPMAFRRGFIEIKGALKKVFVFCRENFPGEVINTALIGAGIQNDYSKNGMVYTEAESENRIKMLAKEVGINVNVVKIP